MIDRYFAFFFLGLAVVFGYAAFAGLRTGSTKIPMALISFEIFDRSDSGANFWGVTVLNMAVAIGLPVLVVYWWMEGMIV